MMISNIVLNCLALACIFASVCVTAQSLGEWKVIGRTGASAMHLVVTAPNRIVILDKAELNPEAVFPDGRTGWTTEYNLDTNEFRMLNLATNTFCSAGAFLENGTLVETAGGQANVRAKSGYSKIRLFSPCQDNTCDWLEIEHDMDAARWYNTMITLPDGRAFNIGGSTKATAINEPKKNNPTYEFYPEVGQIEFDFLVETLPYNLYPIVHVLPDRSDTLFIFANKKSILFDWTTGTVIKRLPDIPGTPRTYPLTASSAMLPLTYENNYKPEVIICGGSKRMRRTVVAENNCGRLNLAVDNPQWEMDDFGGFPRVMPDNVILADGKIVFLNGAGLGYAGYDKRRVHMAENPVKTPILYDPNAPLGKRWTTLAPSTIARVYHSVATLVPDGSIFVAGSNPNEDFNNVSDFPTEYRAERFSPPYLFLPVQRPSITTFANTHNINKNPIHVTYGQEVKIGVAFEARVKEPVFTSSIIHYGFVTHSQHMGQRYVQLEVLEVREEEDSKGEEWWVTIRLPPRPEVISPGPSYVYLLHQGRPAVTAVHVLLKRD